VRSQVLGKIFAARRHLFIGEAAHCPRVVLKPLGGFLDPQVSNWVSGPGFKQAPVHTLCRRCGLVNAAQYLFAPKALVQHVD
jgi:hypothetical protein